MTPFGPIRTVVAAVDFGESSGRVLAFAREAARAFGSKLHVVHVVHDLEAYIGFYLTPKALPSLVEEMRQEAEERMLWICKEHLPEGEPLTTRVLQGAPTPTLLAYVEEQEAPLLVLGRHGRAKPEHAILGSTADRVSAQAVCPVVTVR